MARNYVEFFSSRVNQGGNYVSFIKATEQEARDAATSYIASNGGTADWLGKKGYFLVKKVNVIGLLDNWCTHYSSSLGSAWIFFQNGGVAQSSPRKKWHPGA